MSYELFGFKEIQQSLLENFHHQKLHHGLLLCGNQGIGKASFAFDLASQIITSSSKNKSEDLKKIESNSHPDLLIIKKDEKKRDIAVDAVREINQFLSLTAAISEYRVIIIDAVDDLNKNSSNAILKILEEPPSNVFLLLINHNPQRLLDTIKSRCRIIKINNPNYDDFKTQIQKILSEISEEEIKILAKISNHSIGLAVEMHGYNAFGIYDQIKQIIASDNQKEVFNLAKKITSEDELWGIFERLVIFYLYTSCHSRESGNPGNSETKLDSRFRGNDSLGKVFAISDKITNLLTTTKNLNLDKSQTIINIFNIIKNAEN